MAIGTMETAQDILTNGESNPVYYVTEARNATLRELLRMCPPTIRGKLGAFLLKILRLDSPHKFGMAINDAIRCSIDDISELHEMFHSTIRDLAHLGFSPIIAQRLPILGEGSCCSLAFLGNDPTEYAIIVYAKAWANGQEYDESGLSFISRDETTIWVTSSVIQRLKSSRNFNVQHFPDNSPDFLRTTHRRRMKAIPKEMLRVFDAENLLFALREIDALITEFNIARGVLRPMTIAEIGAVTRDEDRF